jgi:hypothetical protein
MTEKKVRQKRDLLFFLAVISFACLFVYAKFRYQASPSKNPEVPKIDEKKGLIYTTQRRSGLEL